MLSKHQNWWLVLLGVFSRWLFPLILSLEGGCLYYQPIVKPSIAPHLHCMVRKSISLNEVRLSRAHLILSHGPKLDLSCGWMKDVPSYYLRVPQCRWLPMAVTRGCGVPGVPMHKCSALELKTPGQRDMPFANLLHLTVQTYLYVSLLLPVFLVVFEDKSQFSNCLKTPNTCIRGIPMLNIDSESQLRSSLSQCFYIPDLAERRRNGENSRNIHLHQNLEVVWTNTISLSLFP